MTKNARLPFSRALSLALAVVCSIAPAAGWQGPRDGDDPPVGAGDVDVYIDDSFEAADAIGEARRLAKRGKWHEAVRLLQQTSDRSGKKLVRVSPGYYVGIRRYINELIAGFPSEGIEAYRTAYETEARAALADVRWARSPDDLLGIFEKYFCTVAVGELADTIAQSAIEAGDFSLAREVYERVLEGHPDRERYESRYAAMLSVVVAMEGSPSSLDYGDHGATLRFMGKDRTVDDVLGMIEADFARLERAVGPTHWPTFGGDVSRNRQIATNVDEPGLLWRYYVNAPRRGRYAGGDRLEAATDTSDWVRGFEVGMNPVVAGDVVFFQHYREIIALDRHTGAELWRAPRDDENAGGDDFADSEQYWNAATVDGGRVFATLPPAGGSFDDYDVSVDSTELVCLDADTGKTIWRIHRSDLPPEVHDVSFESAPLVGNGRLFVAARRRRSFEFEDCYLLGLSAADGSFRFLTHLGSASTGTFARHQASTVIACMSDDSVYVCTNLGTIAAVSTHTGMVRWLRLYERTRLKQIRESGRSHIEVSPQQYNPMLQVEGQLVCLPVDAGRVIVLAARDGEVLDEIQTDTLGEAEILLGMRENVLCTAGEEVTCYDLTARRIIWRGALPEDVTREGRGIWADDRLLIPTREGVSALSITDGRRRDMSWDLGGHGGNLVGLADQLLVAGDGVISAYVRKAQIWARLRSALKAAPGDPVPALELAEMAFRDREFDEGLRALEEAVERAGGFTGTVDGRVRRRLFENVLKFAGSLSISGKSDLAAIEKLFIYASQSAPQKDDHVAYRLRFAKLFEGASKPERAVRLYQQILRDRSLREIMVPAAGERFSTAFSAPASIVARDRIATLVLRHGRRVYSRCEEEADGLLEIGRKTGHVKNLTRVFQTFPNSRAAPRAMIELARLLAESGAHENAARRLTSALHLYRGEVDQPGLMKRIADEYELAGRVKHAYRWLTKAAREHPDARVDYQGRSVTLVEYRDRLSGVRELVAPTRPTINPPLDHHASVELGETASLMVPWFDSEPTIRWSTVFAYAGGAIRAFDPNLERQRWKSSVPVPQRPELLVATSRLAVFATLYEVFALDVGTGAHLWSIGDVPAELDDQNADWERTNPYRAHTLSGGRLISVREDGRLSCIRIEYGRLLWDRSYRVSPAGPVFQSDSWFVYHSTRVADGADGGRYVLCIVNPQNGELVDKIPIDERRPVEDLFVSLDEQIILISSQAIYSYDIDLRTRRWRVPLSGPVRSAATLIDVDAVYFSQDGRHVRKISLEDGRLLWRSGRLARYDDSGLTLALQGGDLIATTEHSIIALDAAGGNTLWEGTIPDDPRLLRRMVTSSYVVAVNIPLAREGTESAAFFYDHRNASGLVPRDGGVCPLGRLVDTDLRAIMAADGALLIQTGSTIHSWSTGPKP